MLYIPAWALLIGLECGAYLTKRVSKLNFAEFRNPQFGQLSLSTNTHYQLNVTLPTS